MEYTAQVVKEPINVDCLLDKLRTYGLTSTDNYQKVIALHKERILGEFKTSNLNSPEFFESGFSGIERAVDRAKSFATMHSQYYDQLKASQNPTYRLLLNAKNSTLSYFGRSTPRVLSLQEVIFASLDFVEEIKSELTPAREASLVLAGVMADYKNNRVVIKLNAAGQYLEEVNTEISSYEGLLKDVNSSLSELNLSHPSHGELMLARDNINRYLNYWRNEAIKAKQDIVFKGPEVDSVASYEDLCWASVEFCDRFKNNIDNLQEHLYKTQPVLQQIGSTSSQMGSLEAVVFPLTRLALQNVQIIGEASDSMVKIALKPEMDGSFPSELAPILAGFVNRMTGQKMRRDLNLEQTASRILNTNGYFIRR